MSVILSVSLLQSEEGQEKLDSESVAEEDSESVCGAESEGEATKRTQSPESLFMTE